MLGKCTKFLCIGYPSRVTLSRKHLWVDSKLSRLNPHQSCQQCGETRDYVPHCPAEPGTDASNAA
jgi:hypothetical protein